MQKLTLRMYDMIISSKSPGICTKAPPVALMNFGRQLYLMYRSNSDKMTPVFFFLLISAQSISFCFFFFHLLNAKY